MHDRRAVRRAVVLIALVAIAVPVLRALRFPFVSRYVVEGTSMEPAFRSGDRVLVNRLAYRSRAPRAGEVVVLDDPERQGHVLLKRVAEAPDSFGATTANVYVLGDNTAESRDSRAFGTVALGQILGKAWVKY